MCSNHCKSSYLLTILWYFSGLRKLRGWGWVGEERSGWKRVKNRIRMKFSDRLNNGEMKMLRYASSSNAQSICVWQAALLCCRKWKYVSIKLNEVGVEQRCYLHTSAATRYEHGLDRSRRRSRKSAAYTKFQYKYSPIFSSSFFPHFVTFRFAIQPFCCIFLSFANHLIFGFSPFATANEKVACNDCEQMYNAYKQQINAINRVAKIYDFTVSTRYMAAKLNTDDETTYGHRKRYGWLALCARRHGAKSVSVARARANAVLPAIVSHINTRS